MKCEDCKTVRQICRRRHLSCLCSLIESCGAHINVMLNKIDILYLINSRWTAGLKCLLSHITTETTASWFIYFIMFSRSSLFEETMAFSDTINVALACAIRCFETYPNLKFATFNRIRSSILGYYVNFCNYANYTGLLLLDRIIMLHDSFMLPYLLIDNNCIVFQMAWQTYTHYNHAACFIHVVVHGYNLFPAHVKKIANNYFNVLPTIDNEIEIINAFNHSNRLTNKVIHVEEPIANSNVVENYGIQLPALSIPIDRNDEGV